MIEPERGASYTVKSWSKVKRTFEIPISEMRQEPPSERQLIFTSSPTESVTPQLLICDDV